MESVHTHLCEVSDMAAEFARVFGAESWGRLAGLAHDLGKYSDAFQDRILRNGHSVDHSTAGALTLLQQCHNDYLAYCVAGHHGGLPNGATEIGATRNSLSARIANALAGEIPDFQAYTQEIEKFTPIRFSPDMEKSLRSRSPKDVAFFLQAYTRMIYSCLVDADYLCTERFMNNGAHEGLHYDSLEIINEKLETKLAGFYPPQTPINQARCGVLDDCLKASINTRGVYTLTAPTGSGKTYALMRFALNHAIKNSMHRVICVEPYTSIIEQNADVYRDVLGSENVLEHHSNCDFFDKSDNVDGLGARLRYASENWDAPVIVTTNVQLFESLFANKPSRCRKLHNIAGSVIVLDEAQMIPTDYLLPCVKMLAELVKSFGCTVVLCSATQPALDPYFEDEGLPAQEIISDIDGLFEALARVTYEVAGSLSDADLADALAQHDQALCIVNSRRQARELFDLLRASRGGNGVYHLTTMMYPDHRKQVLKEITQRVRSGEPCLVIATSLVEAGVDLDFPVVYRALCGVDSLVQAAGRCNREMKRSREESIVTVFDSSEDYRIPRDLDQRSAIARGLLERADAEAPPKLDSIEMVEAYFRDLYQVRGRSELDAQNVISAASPGKKVRGVVNIPFELVADKVKLINEGSHSIVIPTADSEASITALRNGYATRFDMRVLSRSSVNVYDADLRVLDESGAIEAAAEGLYILLDQDRYKEDIGLDSSAAGGSGLFW